MCSAKEENTSKIAFGLIFPVQGTDVFSPCVVCDAEIYKSNLQTNVAKISKHD